MVVVVVVASILCGGAGCAFFKESERVSSETT